MILCWAGALRGGDNASNKKCKIGRVHHGELRKVHRGVAFELSSRSNTKVGNTMLGPRKAKGKKARAWRSSQSAKRMRMGLTPLPFHFSPYSLSSSPSAFPSPKVHRPQEGQTACAAILSSARDLHQRPTGGVGDEMKHCTRRQNGRPWKVRD